MWALSNHTPFAAESSFARDRDGAEVLLVVVKATFRIGRDETLHIADEQVPVYRTPRMMGDELLHDGDVALVKHATDVLLLGHARARGGQPTVALEVGLRVGDWHKRALVFGDRTWKRSLAGWRMSDPKPFTCMPLSYRRAFGGRDGADDTAVYEPNPIGVGYTRRPEAGQAVPNLEDPDERMTSPRSTPPPMSFGPIARHWPLRLRLAGSYDERWQRERRPLVPDDFDDAFYQSAPTDQQLALQGGEAVELSGVSPRGPLRFELPQLSLSFSSRLAGARIEHPWSLHGVLFEPDDGRVTMLAHSALPCHRDLHALESTVVEEARAA